MYPKTQKKGLNKGGLLRGLQFMFWLEAMYLTETLQRVLLNIQ